MFRYTSIFTVALLSFFFLSACSNVLGKSASSSDWREDSHNAYYESLGIHMDYPSTWKVTETDRGTFSFIPPGEDGDAVKIRFGSYNPLWGYERCPWNKMKQRGKSLDKWASCYRSDFLMNDGYIDSSIRDMQGGDIQIIEAHSEIDGKDNLFAYFSGARYDGQYFVVEVRFEAVPEKFEEYLPIVEEMLETLRSSR